MFISDTAIKRPILTIVAMLGLVVFLAMIGAKAKELHAERIVFDGFDVLLGYLRDPKLIRREIFRVREWVHASGLSAIVTAKIDGRDFSSK